MFAVLQMLNEFLFMNNVRCAEADAKTDAEADPLADAVACYMLITLPRHNENKNGK